MPKIMDYSDLCAELADTAFAGIIDKLPKDFLNAFNHGDFAGWVAALQNLPELVPVSWDIQHGMRVGEPGQCSDQEREVLAAQLMKLHPWRKGPFELFGLELDTEWHSDWKWDRLKDKISPLAGRNVLDVGCGNGYHCWRMAGEGARLVIGADSHLLFTMQYWAIRHFLQVPAVHVVPLALEQLPEHMQAFDTVFSMGVLYHTRSPFNHLISLRHALRSGGELVLETIVTDGAQGHTLVPIGRYARMPNVWFLPSCNTLALWLEKSGYTDVELLDVSTTTVEEQRSTSWMNFESLPEALDKVNPALTIEGYPAPKRAIFKARKP